MTGRLAGKVALISGGARGMGASHAREMVAQGAKVVCGDILDGDGELVAKELGEDARYVHLDVTRTEDWQAAVAHTVTEFGGLDVLVNNAGILNIGTVEDFELSEWHRILDINLTGVFLGIRAVTPTMKDAGHGSIINISSIEGMAGTIASHGYTATKFAVRGLTKSVALELGQFGIRVNSVHPGLVKTPMADWVPEDIFSSALGRIAQPREVSNMVVYLASDESSFSTGSEFVVDGGVLAGLAHKDFSAVDVEQHVGAGIDGLREHLHAALVVHAGLLEDRAVVERAGEPDLAERARPLERNDIEPPVAGIGLRCDLHAAPEVLPVRDRQVEHRRLPRWAIVDSNPHCLVAVADHGPGRTQEERQTPAHPLGALVDDPVDVPADAKAGDVQKRTRGGLPVVVGVVEPARVQRSRHRLHQPLGHRFRLVRESEGFPKVAAGAAGHRSEPGTGRDDRAVRLEEAVHRFVQGAVAANNRDALGPFAEGVPHQLGGVSRAFCLPDVDACAVVLERSAEASQLPFCAPSARSGIDDQYDGLHRGTVSELTDSEGAEYSSTW
mgnify:CR=1 FL=1